MICLFIPEHSNVHYKIFIQSIRCIFLVNNEKYQRWALKSSSFIYFASASPQPLNRILHLNEK